MASYDNWPLARFPHGFFQALEDDGGAHPVPYSWTGSTVRIAWYAFLRELRRHPTHPLYPKAKTYWYVVVREGTITALPKVKAEDPGFSDQGAALIASALGMPKPRAPTPMTRRGKHYRKHRYSFVADAELDEPPLDGKGEPE